MVLIQTEFKKEPKMIPQASAMVNAFQLTGAVVGVAYVTFSRASGLKVTDITFDANSGLQQPS